MTVAAAAATSSAMVVDIFVKYLDGGVVRVQCPFANYDITIASAAAHQAIRNARAHALTKLSWHQEIPDSIEFHEIRKKESA